MNSISNSSKTIFYFVFFIIILIAYIVVNILNKGSVMLTACLFVFFIMSFLSFLVNFLLYFDIQVDDSEVCLISTVKKQIFRISEIEILEVSAGLGGKALFSMIIMEAKIYRFNYICYTRKNFNALIALIEKSMNSRISIYDLEQQVNSSVWMLHE